MEKKQNSNKSNTTRDVEFDMSLSSEDINKIKEKIMSEDDTKIQNNRLINRVVLINTCTNCGNRFKPVNSMIWETLCDLCIR